jgi:hypothetical protein
VRSGVLEGDGLPIGLHGGWITRYVDEREAKWKSSASWQRITEAFGSIHNVAVDG